ncbi:uncharacterized protein LOC121860102 [Homarus americanus]|uniref:uncharacterized protein LOC121860102 n=1 Tax=Homarus americanus TaxID=6706 RepID=UPI001C46DD0D|nr:uncharacterized protein LOC121860102 [Homarus americanus]
MRLCEPSGRYPAASAPPVEETEWSPLREQAPSNWESTRTGVYEDWGLRGLGPTRTGVYQNWGLQELGSTRIGVYQNWGLPELSPPELGETGVSRVYQQWGLPELGSTVTGGLPELGVHQNWGLRGLGSTGTGAYEDWGLPELGSTRIGVYKNWGAGIHEGSICVFERRGRRREESRRGSERTISTSEGDRELMELRDFLGEEEPFNGIAPSFTDTSVKGEGVGVKEAGMGVREARSKVMELRDYLDGGEKTKKAAPMTAQHSVPGRRLADVSIAGMSRVCGAGCPRWQRWAWSLVLLTCTALMSAQVWDRLTYYLSTPVTVNVRVTRNQTLRFPIVSFCNKNQFNMTAVKELQEQRAALLGETNASVISSWDISQLVGTNGMDASQLWVYIKHKLELMVEEVGIVCVWSRLCGEVFFDRYP